MYHILHDVVYTPFPYKPQTEVLRYACNTSRSIRFTQPKTQIKPIWLTDSQLPAQLTWDQQHSTDPAPSSTHEIDTSPIAHLIH